MGRPADPAYSLTDPETGKKYAFKGDVYVVEGVIHILDSRLREICRKEDKTIISERMKQYILNRCPEQLIAIAGAQEERRRENVARHGQQTGLRDVRRRRLHLN